MMACSAKQPAARVKLTAGNWIALLAIVMTPASAMVLGYLDLRDRVVRLDERTQGVDQRMQGVDRDVDSIRTRLLRMEDRLTR